MGLIRFLMAAQLVVLATCCSAADFGSRAAQTQVAPTSFYMGVQGGVAWARDKMSQASINAHAFDMAMGSDAAFGGLHVGYQRNIDNVVVGFEADYDRGGKQGSATFTDAAQTTYTRSYQMDYRSTLRARVGYDFGPFAVYATGGGALTNARLNGSALGASSSENAFAFGATVGAGFAYRLSPHWSAFSEYRYADYGRSPIRSETGVGLGGKAEHRITETSVRAGATYYFR